MHDVELRQLRVFVAIAEAGTVTGAAERLHVVQSAASATLRGLERELGAELVERRARGVVLSDAGRALLPEARRVLAAADVAREAVDAVRGGLRGTVRLGVMQSQRGVYSIPDLLRRFGEHHPGVEVLIRHTGGSAEMAAHVADGTLDLAFVALAAGDAHGARLTPLAREPIDLVCAVGHRLAARRAVRLGELTAEPFADLPPGWGTRMAVDRALAAAALRRTVSYEVNDIAAVLDFVRHGLAIALLPASIAGQDAELALVPIRPRTPVLEVSLATPASSVPSAAAAALAAAITG
jgi:DNA-binding transcriptional LysR family regulator